jgi:enoyl-CoA hydratase/carnithine racemase
MELRDEILDCFKNLQDDKDVKVLILTGREDCFSAGYDLKEVLNTDGKAFEYKFLEFHQTIYRFKKIIICAVGGVCLAGGLDLCLCGDFIIANKNAVFGTPEIKFGLNPFISKLQKKTGIKNAYHFAIFGENITASQAKEIGLVDKVVENGKLLSYAKEIAEKIIKIPDVAIYKLKEAYRNVYNLSEEEGLKFEVKTHKEILKEGKFLELLKNYFLSLKEKK